MARIVKSFDKTKKPHEIDSGGLTSQRSWEGLKPFLNEAFAIKDNENIIGIIADEDGVQVRIETLETTKKRSKK